MKLSLIKEMFTYNNHGKVTDSAALRVKCLQNFVNVYRDSNINETAPFKRNYLCYTNYTECFSSLQFIEV